MACSPPYCGPVTYGSWCGCPCPSCICSSVILCPCYTSLTWKTTIPQNTNPGCPGGDSIVIYNTISTDACCLVPITTGSIGLTRFKLQGGAGNVSLTNSTYQYTCGIYTGAWRIGLDGTYADGTVTKAYNNCDTITVNGSTSGVNFCCPISTTVIDSWVNGTLCPDAPPPSLIAQRKKAKLIRSIASRFKKIN